jgi:2-polyprenyl-3-methyl-5-hydroxy-6-metoxy-1,4-benzoquinol methylase
MHDTGRFYEEYWQSRRRGDYLYREQVPARLGAALEFIAAAGHEAVRVLDLGCGEGTLGRLMGEKLGDRVYRVGLDLAETALEMASAHYDEVVQANLELDPWPELLGGQIFHCIVCVEVLEHLFRPEKALEACKGLLAPDGVLILSFPNFAFYKNRYDVLRGRFPRSQHVYHSAEHIHYFTMHSFDCLLASCGLVATDIGGSYALPWLANRLPERIRRAAFRTFPNLFGNQIVVSTRVAT